MHRFRVSIKYDLLILDTLVRRNFRCKQVAQCDVDHLLYKYGSMSNICRVLGSCLRNDVNISVIRKIAIIRIAFA